MPSDKPDDVIITDVTLREYGQNIPTKYLYVFTPEIRVEIALKLISAGIRNVEIISCVHPKISPAMNKEALGSITQELGKIDGVNLITLVPNRAGYDTFLELGLDQDEHNYTMGVFFSAIEAHNIANLGRPIKETIEEYKQIMQDASRHNIRMIGYISATFGYFEPKKGVLIKPNLYEVDNYINLLFDLGVDTVTLSDLQGVANKERTRKDFEIILNKRSGNEMDKLGYHPHHISEKAAVANSTIAYELGVRRFDSSLGGTGGCVTGAPGNQPTEMLVDSFHSLGIQTGINRKKIFTLRETVRNELYSKIPLAEIKR